MMYLFKWEEEQNCVFHVFFWCVEMFEYRKYSFTSFCMNMNTNIIIYFVNTLFGFSSRSTKCPARLIKPIDNDDSRHYSIKKSHSHTPDSRELGKKKITHKMKTLAKTTHMGSRQIVQTAMTNVKNAVAAVIPSSAQLRQTINRVRMDPNVPKNPKNLSELRFSDKYSKTISGKDFILYDRSEDDDDGRLIIFGTKDNLDFLVRCEGLFMEGTFGIVPALFYQLYTIHGK